MDRRFVSAVFAMRGNRVIVSTALIGVIMMFAVSCVGGTADRQIMGIQSVSADERSLWLSVASCNGNPTAEVDEGEDEIVVRVRGGDTNDDCADGVCIRLDEPLAGRTLTDATTNRLVPLEDTDSRLGDCP
jgi:hypothetical protein